MKHNTIRFEHSITRTEYNISFPMHARMLILLEFLLFCFLCFGAMNEKNNVQSESLEQLLTTTAMVMMPDTQVPK